MSYGRPSCSRQRNSGYRPSRVNIVAQGLSMHSRSPLSPTHPTIRRGRATTTHYTHHQVSLMVSHNTTLVPSLGLRIGPACEAGLSADMRRERVSPQIRKKKERKTVPIPYSWQFHARGMQSKHCPTQNMVHALLSSSLSHPRGVRNLSCWQ